eukprot:1161367-Pelagomonas_calceolata.AAC.2
MTLAVSYHRRAQGWHVGCPALHPSQPLRPLSAAVVAAAAAAVLLCRALQAGGRGAGAGNLQRSHSCCHCWGRCARS